MSFNKDVSDAEKVAQQLNLWKRKILASVQVKLNFWWGAFLSSRDLCHYICMFSLTHTYHSDYCQSSMREKKRIFAAAFTRSTKKRKKKEITQKKKKEKESRWLLTRSNVLRRWLKKLTKVSHPDLSNAGEWKKRNNNNNGFGYHAPVPIAQASYC